MPEPRQFITRAAALTTRIWSDPVWSKVIAAGILSVIGIIFVFAFGSSSNQQGFKNDNTITSVNGGLTIDSAKQIARKPIWDDSTLSKDEIIAKIVGSYSPKNYDKLDDVKLIAFYRKSGAFSTNWYLGKRRDGSNYQLDSLDGQSAAAGRWEFLVEGIEVDQTYKGSLSVIIMALKTKQVDALAREYRDKEEFGGYTELPVAGRLAISAPLSFDTTPVR
jgi:hypothetical protein